MTCATPPVFWQRQQRMPLPVQRFLRSRLEGALRDSSRRSLLVWPTILGAPKQRETHPDGIPEAELMALAERMLEAVGTSDPRKAWERDLEAFPDTADSGSAGWVPQRIWEPMASQVSLRSGVALLALTGQPQDESYRLSSGVTLFNLALFHECHDALEVLWRGAEGNLKTGLQGLILLAAGFYHQQHHDAAGMLSLWKDGLPMLGRFEGKLDTPWGRVDFQESLAMASRRLEWLMDEDDEVDLEGFWTAPPPEWGLK